jgi:hypothetical protein
MGAFMMKPAPSAPVGKPRPERPIYPYVDNVTNEYNFPMTTLPRPTAETHVVVNPKDPNNIVASANDMNNPSQDTWLHYYTSKDGGKSWGDGIVSGYRGGPPSVLTGFGTSCDPALGFDMNNNVYLAGVGYNRHMYAHTGRANCIFVARSSNGGDSFDQVSIVHTAMFNMMQFNDKEWLAVDLNNGNVYVTWTIFAVGEMTGSIVFSKSTDQGRTWTPRAHMSRSIRTAPSMSSGGISTTTRSITPAPATSGRTGRRLGPSSAWWRSPTTSPTGPTGRPPCPSWP